MTKPVTPFSVVERAARVARGITEKTVTIKKTEGTYFICVGTISPVLLKQVDEAVIESLGTGDWDLIVCCTLGGSGVETLGTI